MRRLQKIEDCASLILLAGAIVLLTVEAVCSTAFAAGLALLKKVEGR